ncbi:MAG: hypothetical protein RL562_2482 [Planctomycetota bacterium]
MATRFLLLPAVLAVATACGGPEERTDPARAPASDVVPEVVEVQEHVPPGVRVWHEDFPGAPKRPHVSPRRPGGFYDRTPRQAVEQVVANLQGNCSRDAWLFAKEFFGRVDEEDLDLLVAALDQSLQIPSRLDLVENALEALGRTGSARGGPALIRALEHPRVEIRNKVMQALSGAGDAETVRIASRMFDTVDGRGMEGWIRGAVKHLPTDEAVTALRTLLVRGDIRLVREVVVQNALRLPPEAAVQVFQPLIGKEPPELITTMAVLRHITGDAGGTSLCIDLLDREAPQARLGLLQALLLGGAEDLLDRILPKIVDPDAGVRAALVPVLAGIPGEAVDSALETLAADEAVEVRRAALGALSQRGVRGMLEDLVEVVRTGTGTRVSLAIQDLIAARDGGAIPALAERMEKVSDEERFDLLRAVALTTAPESFAPLRAFFLEDSEIAATHRSTCAYLMRNCRGAEAEILELFHAIPREDYRRRALLLDSLANIAVDREDPDVAAPIFAMVRQVLADREEIPQMRLLALEDLRRDFRPADLKALLRASPEEEPAMRRLFNDFLFEFF